MLRTIVIMFTLLAVIGSFNASSQEVWAAKKSAKNNVEKTKKIHKKKVKRNGSRKGNTQYNFRARTYYPWYEGYDGLESYYMQFDRDFGY